MQTESLNFCIAFKLKNTKKHIPSSSIRRNDSSNNELLNISEFFYSILFLQVFANLKKKTFLQTESLNFCIAFELKSRKKTYTNKITN